MLLLWEVLEHDGGCYYCFLDRIILEEAIHFPNAWNNWGNHKFTSNPLPGLHPFRSDFELLFVIFCEPMQTMQQNVNKNNCKVKTGKNTWTWQNITTLLHYIMAQRFLECGHRKRIQFRNCSRCAGEKFFSSFTITRKVLE